MIEEIITTFGQLGLGSKFKILTRNNFRLGVRIPTYCKDKRTVFNAIMKDTLEFEFVPWDSQVFKLVEKE